MTDAEQAAEALEQLFNERIEAVIHQYGPHHVKDIVEQPSHQRSFVRFHDGDAVAVAWTVWQGRFYISAGPKVPYPYAGQG